MESVRKINMETRFTVLLVEIGIALVVEIGVLIAVLVNVKKSGARMESIAAELQQRALPVLESAHSFLETTRPKVEEIMADVAASSGLLREQLQRMDSTVTDIMDRTRLQVIRADEMVSRTLDRVEETTEMVQHTVLSPVRHLAGLVEGITAGIGVLMGKARRGSNFKVPQDEMFI